MREDLTIGLIAASRYDEEVQTRSKFLSACRREQRDIQNFSQGIIEVRVSPHTLPEGESALARSHSDRPSESNLKHKTLDFEPWEGAWVTVAHSGHYFEITKSLTARVSLIHRSAYDFFFDPDGWNKEHVELCRSLFEHNEELNVHAKLQAGLRKLLWIIPWPVRNGYRDQRPALMAELVRYSRRVIRYTVATSNMSSDPSALTEYVDDLLTSMRLELLLVLVKQPILESRKHVPGDIFSSHLHNGCLRALDEDSLLIFESTGLPDDLAIMAEFESRFLYDCAQFGVLRNYVEDRLSMLVDRPIAPLVQASLFDLIAEPRFTNLFWEFERRQVLLLSSVQRWMHVLAQRRRSKQFYNSVWQWLLRFVPGYDDSPRHEAFKVTRLSIAKQPLIILRSEIFRFQWTSLASDDIIGQHEEILIRALVSYGIHFLGVCLPGHRQVAVVMDRLVQIVDRWDVWIDIFSVEERPHNHTALFVRLGSLFNANPKGGAEPLLDSRGPCYRLTYTESPTDDIGSAKPLFSVDANPSIALYDGPQFMAREHVSDKLRAAPLKRKQADALIDVVRQSTELDDDQKSCMIEGIKAFKLRGPKT